MIQFIKELFKDVKVTTWIWVLIVVFQYVCFRVFSGKSFDAMNEFLFYSVLVTIVYYFAMFIYEVINDKDNWWVFRVWAFLSLIAIGYCSIILLNVFIDNYNEIDWRYVLSASNSPLLAPTIFAILKFIEYRNEVQIRNIRKVSDEIYYNLYDRTFDAAYLRFNQLITAYVVRHCPIKVKTYLDYQKNRVDKPNENANAIDILPQSVISQIQILSKDMDRFIFENTEQWEEIKDEFENDEEYFPNENNNDNIPPTENDSNESQT
jgi:hypothetical protein